MNNDLISREALEKHAIWTKVNNGAELIDIEVVPLVAIDNAPTVEPQDEWYDCINPNCLKARHGNYVLYKIDYLLKNLPKEIYLLEIARRMMRGNNNG